MLTHRLGLLLCDVKKPSIKHGDVIFDEVAALGVEAALLVGVWVMIRLGGEAVLGNLGPAASLATEHTVELSGRGHIPRQTAGHAHDGDGHRLLVRHDSATRRPLHKRGNMALLTDAG